MSILASYFVEEGLYRSALPTELNIPFLESLGLKSIVVLGDYLDEALVGFIDKFGINYVRVENTITRTDSGSGLNSIPIGDDVVVSALRILANRNNMPALVCCRSGKYLTGVVIGCLRKLERWSFVSILEEYRRMASYSGSSMQQQHEQFIELFDTDLVEINESAPDFLRAIE
jgi:tyrosine-protein phosphatase OCA1